ncbi:MULTISPECIES: class I SAM-dependent methyltransferase [Kitasatospora]|uniref:Putative methyltransferase n=1 Tax=Kitasatospora setae (strain ATCC 33774 / DSM 43861 / JCM 3304 / KCC A-0304 / NBRC 14216 / KM-6054) TaxID=452652 RepID=E4NJD4_KITSK|nr:MULTISPECIES: class I SAM-dependent methyltransferase [Kitasatospora]BAJ33082.1 putative methyltransferase [Kitasatospora setae KM-6054]
MANFTLGGAAADTDEVIAAYDALERRIWTGRAAAYAASFARLCARPVPDLLDAAGVGPGTALLDVGTGTGAVAAAACARGARVTAVDAEPSMLTEARRNAPGAAVHAATLPELTFADRTFDAVVGNFVINHVGRQRAAVAELRRVLRPGGRLALTTWATPAPRGQSLLGRAVEAAGAPRPAHLPPAPAALQATGSPDGLTALLAAAGLPDAHCRTLRWDHRTTVEEWWAGPAGRVAFIGELLHHQTPEVRAGVRREFVRLAEEFRTADGALALPHAALLVSARR